MIKQVNTEEFKNEIKEGIVFVDFFANWCGPCKMLSPVVEQLSEEIKDVNFLKVDVDLANEIAVEYGVMSIPTLIMFKGGKEVAKQIGLMPKDALIDFINENK